MKAVFVLLDGASEGPLSDLGGRTPLEAAELVGCDEIARQGTVGLVSVIPPELPPQPEVACLSLLGYDPLLYYTGRGAFVALGLQAPVGAKDVVFCCHLVSTDGERLLSAAVEDLTPEESQALMSVVSEKLKDRRFQFVIAERTRHLLIWRDGEAIVQVKPPEEVVGELISEHLPSGEGEDRLQALIYDSVEILDGHEVNRKRRDEGKAPANMVWLFEPGQVPVLPSFRLTAGMIRADVLSTHPAVRGVCQAAGIRLLRGLPVPMEQISKGYEELRRLVFSVLPLTDLLLVHLQEADKAAHRKDADLKVFALERFDKVVLQPLWKHLERYEDVRLLLACTHRTSCVTGRHEHGAVPFLLFPRRTRRSSADEFHELCASEEGIKVDSGTELARMMLGT